MAMESVVDQQGSPQCPASFPIQRNSAITSHNLSLSGGTQRVNYFVSLGYLYQQGMWSTTDYQRFNLQSNLSVKATPTTTVDLALGGWHEKKRYPGVSSGDIMYQAYRTPPVSAIEYTNGLWGQYVGKSLYGMAYHSGYSKEPNDQINATLSITQELPFVKRLSIKGTVNYDPYRSRSKNWLTPMPVYTLDASVTPYDWTEGFHGPEKPYLTESCSEDVTFTYQGMINYNNSFGPHNVTALAVIEARDKNCWNLGARRNNYGINVDEINAGSSDPSDISNSGSSWKERQVGYVFRAGYNYDNRYLVELSGRYDGHYYFAPGKRFDLDALFQGATRTNISLGETLVMPFFDSGSATKLQFKDHWTPANQNARYPRLTSEVTVNNHRQSSSWWVRDATYLRLKSIEIGYTLPRKALDFLHISQLRVYVSGQNLWTWTPFIKELVDPEAGSANGKYYMQQAVYSFGLNITF